MLLSSLTVDLHAQKVKVRIHLQYNLFQIAERDL